jgi:HAMP domain-containing protein
MRMFVWRALKKPAIKQRDSEETPVERKVISGEVERKLRQILEALDAAKKGDLTKRLNKEKDDILGELADSYNDMVEMLEQFSNEVTRVTREVGTEGKLGGRAEVPGVAGTWLALTNNVNRMASNLTDQVRDIADVTTAVVNGDLTQKITVEASGEVLDLKNTINKMVEDLTRLAKEVSKVAQMARAWKETSASERKLMESRRVGRVSWIHSMP